MLKDASFPLTITVSNVLVKHENNNEDLSRPCSGEHTHSIPTQVRYGVAFNSVKNAH
jgi:hypothetical protein